MNMYVLLLRLIINVCLFMSSLNLRVKVCMYMCYFLVLDFGFMCVELLLWGLIEP